MKKFIFTKTHEQIDCFTVYWKAVRPAEDDISNQYSKDFMTEIEARKYAENLKHDPNVLYPDEITCEYRKIVDLSRPQIDTRSNVIQEPPYL